MGSRSGVSLGPFQGVREVPGQPFNKCTGLLSFGVGFVHSILVCSRALLGPPGSPLGPLTVGHGTFPAVTYCWCCFRGSRLAPLGHLGHVLGMPTGVCFVLGGNHMLSPCRHVVPTCVSLGSAWVPGGSPWGPLGVPVAVFRFPHPMLSRWWGRGCIGCHLPGKLQGVFLLSRIHYLDVFRILATQLNCYLDRNLNCGQSTIMLTLWFWMWHLDVFWNVCCGIRLLELCVDFRSILYVFIP